jgi:hypothetical protein
MVLIGQAFALGVKDFAKPLIFADNMELIVNEQEMLKAAVNWKFSYFTHTAAPVISDSGFDIKSGVRMMRPSIRAAAARMESNVTCMSKAVPM